MSGRLPEDKDCVSSESSGELGLSVPPRTHRRGSPLRRACPNKSTKSVNTRNTLENDGEPSFSASPHRHRTASSLRHVCPKTKSTKPSAKHTSASRRSPRHPKGRKRLESTALSDEASSEEEEDTDNDERDDSPSKRKRLPRSKPHHKRKERRRVVADANGEIRRPRKIAVVVLKAVRLPSQT